jgi:hypothetical protein
MIPISREHYEQAIARLNELDEQLPRRKIDLCLIPRHIELEIKYWEQVMWSYETHQHKAREVPLKTD